MNWVTVLINHTILHHHDFLVTGGFDLNTTTELGSVFELVDGTVEHQTDGWQDSVFKHEGNVTVGFKLTSVDGLSELVLGTQDGVGFDGGLDGRHHHGFGHDWLLGGLDGGFQTGFEVWRHLSPEGTDNGTLRLELGRSNPVAGVVSTCKRDCSLGWAVWIHCIVDGFHTERQLRGDGLHQRTDEQTVVLGTGDVWVQSLQLDGEVAGLVLVFQLAHRWLAVCQLQRHLGGDVLIPGIVQSTGQREFVIDGTLDQRLVVCDDRCERVGRQVAADGKAMCNLEHWVHCKRLVDIGLQTGELVQAQKHILGDLLVDVFHHTRVDQVE